jgi:hypothetical protein
MPLVTPENAYRPPPAIGVTSPFWADRDDVGRVGIGQPDAQADEAAVLGGQQVHERHVGGDRAGPVGVDPHDERSIQRPRIGLLVPALGDEQAAVRSDGHRAEHERVQPQHGADGAVGQDAADPPVAGVGDEVAPIGQHGEVDRRVQPRRPRGPAVAATPERVGDAVVRQVPHCRLQAPGRIDPQHEPTAGHREQHRSVGQRRHVRDARTQAHVGRLRSAPVVAPAGEQPQVPVGADAPHATAVRHQQRAVRALEHRARCGVRRQAGQEDVAGQGTARLGRDAPVGADDGEERPGRNGVGQRGGRAGPAQDRGGEKRESSDHLRIAHPRGLPGVRIFHPANPVRARRRRPSRGAQRGRRPSSAACRIGST